MSDFYTNDETKCNRTYRGWGILTVTVEGSEARSYYGRSRVTAYHTFTPTGEYANTYPRLCDAKSAIDSAHNADNDKQTNEWGWPL